MDIVRILDEQRQADSAVANKLAQQLRDVVAAAEHLARHQEEQREMLDAARHSSYEEMSAELATAQERQQRFEQMHRNERARHNAMRLRVRALTQERTHTAGFAQAAVDAFAAMDEAAAAGDPLAAQTHLRTARECIDGITHKLHPPAEETP